MKQQVPRSIMLAERVDFHATSGKQKQPLKNKTKQTTSTIPVIE
jgi:hypothetical protein